MKTKIAIAVSTALLSMSANAAPITSPIVVVSKPANAIEGISHVDVKSLESEQVVRTRAVFTPEADLPAGKYRYFVRLVDSPVALYQGGIDGYAATSPEKVKYKSRKLDVNSKNVKSYRELLNTRQDSVLSKARTLIGKLDVKQRTTLAYNGMVIEMTQEEAAKLAAVEGVAQVQREILRKPMTDSGPAIIKAPSVWSGEATGTKSQGEGMIVGIIDTGINTDHPSFADVGGDGYNHSNPWGNGVYSGDCATDSPELCNDKLIGVHSWPAVTDLYVDYDLDVPANGEDHNGHGSHTAGTTAGNVLVNMNVPDVDGGETGVIFDSMSGVAPHANIVSYQVCLPGEDDAIGFGGCFPSLTVLAVEHAIEHGIDALNYSIGGGSSNPWNDADALAFLSARKAGIHVATSAGNDGPGPETVGSPGDAPWITTVAAYTHDRDFSDKTIGDFTGGDTEAPKELTGKAMTGAFSGSIVYAGDFENPNDPDNDPAQCLEPFPENTFAADTIVVCDRGEIARVDKGRNVKAGGASALVLANVIGGADSVVADAHVLPAIHINAAQGEQLRTWLATGKDHKANISGTEVVHDDKIARIAADFTSRGPNKSVPDVIAPSIAAPGVSIFAAYANEQSDAFKENPDPADYGFLSGTSMASPHIAGALTLLASVHPEWTPAEVQSALMMTANQETFKEDGETPSDFFDMGAGYANVEAAAKTGLVMDETYVDYVKADPSLGGQPSQINLATMANAKCVDTCTWTRTVKATKDGAWAASSLGVTDGLVLTVTPAAFELKAGETQELTVTADVSAASAGWNFANIKLVSEGMPEVKLPVAVKSNSHNLPNSLLITAGRQKGSFTYSGYVSDELSNIKVGAYDKESALTKPYEMTVPEDGYDFVALAFSENVPNITFSTSSETAPDVDLRILDAEFRRIGRSAGPDSNESVSFIDLPAGTYYVVVDGYTASTPGGSDKVALSLSAIQPTDATKSDDVEVTVDEAEGEFSLTFNWDTNKSSKGMVFLESGDGSAMVQVPYSIVRSNDVTHVTSLSDAMEAGKASRVSFDVEPNFTDEDREYSFTAQVSTGHKIANISHDGVLEGNTISWTVLQKAASGESLSVGFDLIPTRVGTAYGLILTNERDGDLIEEKLKFGVAEVAPVAMIEAPSSVVEKTSVTLSGAASYDGNDDSLTYQWVQTGGVPVRFGHAGASITFDAPAVDSKGTILSFELTVFDGHGNSDTSSTVLTVTKASDNDNGGSMGWVALMLLPFAWMRRKSKA
ncbi:S8 family serine peptidase [Shewanella alkalitolerans]|uniref:S8 family serine peptidase n=1 Tax=Shewanella alkalitolerans TaxID=2864209 RepID=UPI001C657993|nr:S8 family serine peptidase [Shewanella alkalitolerans]QYJ98410.1 S8 family serine peptidase [Shewanella alkalitolerans]